MKLHGLQIQVLKMINVTAYGLWSIRRTELKTIQKISKTKTIQNLLPLSPNSFLHVLSWMKYVNIWTCQKKKKKKSCASCGSIDNLSQKEHNNWAFSIFDVKYYAVVFVLKSMQLVMPFMTWSRCWVFWRWHCQAVIVVSSCPPEELKIWQFTPHDCTEWKCFIGLINLNFTRTLILVTFKTF